MDPALLVHTAGRSELVEQVALVGPVAKIRRDFGVWRDSMATTLALQGTPESVRALAFLGTEEATGGGTT